MEIPMAKPLSTTARKFDPRASGGLFVAGTWSVIAVSLGTFLVWLLL
jgi:hypothetical protein